MILKKWEELPESLKNDAVRPYYDLLAKRKGSLLLKRCFDIVVSALMLLVLSPVFLVLAIAIKLDSPGPVFYRQVRVTQYGEHFRIFKFRSMVSVTDKAIISVTTPSDSKVYDGEPLVNHDAEWEIVDGILPDKCNSRY